MAPGGTRVRLLEEDEQVLGARTHDRGRALAMMLAEALASR